MSTPIITQDRASYLLNYDPETGALKWKVRQSNFINVGDLAGCSRRNGRRSIMIDGKNYEAHNIAWLIIHGTLPKKPLIHINGDKGDIRRSNLIESMRFRSEADAAANIELLRRYLNYDQATGELTASGIWVDGVPNHVSSHGYRVVSLFGHKIYMHRLAFLLVTGSFPVDVVDHIDGDKLNNRWLNLRDVSQQTNAENKQSVQPGNRSSGLLGVHYLKHTKRFCATIKSGGKKHYLGLYDTAQEAHEVYLAAKREIHKGCSI